jgi:hypothetical protein
VHQWLIATSIVNRDTQLTFSSRLRSTGVQGECLVLQDLRFTFRLIAKERGFSAVAIVVLALGIGINAIGFTIVNAAFLRGLPFKDSDRLYMLSVSSQGQVDNVLSI